MIFIHAKEQVKESPLYLRILSQKVVSLISTVTETYKEDLIDTRTLLDKIHKKVLRSIQDEPIKVEIIRHLLSVRELIDSEETRIN